MERSRKGKAAIMKTVVRLRNDMVMVFDAIGEQIPEYQGQYQDVKGKILRDASSDTVFNHWFGCSLEPGTVPPESW
jgi:hypothetical protein